MATRPYRLIKVAKPPRRPEGWPERRSAIFEKASIPVDSKPSVKATLEIKEIDESSETAAKRHAVSNTDEGPLKKAKIDPQAVGIELAHKHMAIQRARKMVAEQKRQKDAIVANQRTTKQARAEERRNKSAEQERMDAQAADARMKAQAAATARMKAQTAAAEAATARVKAADAAPKKSQWFSSVKKVFSRA